MTKHHLHACIRCTVLHHFKKYITRPLNKNNVHFTVCKFSIANIALTYITVHYINKPQLNNKHGGSVNCCLTHLSLNSEPQYVQDRVIYA